jgi:hypothetical protein
MTDQHPAEGTWAEAWPQLRRKWLDEELTIERLVRESFVAGWDARKEHTAAKTEALRLAYSPDGEREREEQPFRAKVPPFEAPRSWVRDIMQKARPEQSPGTIEPEPARYPVGPPPVTRIDDYTEVTEQEFPLDYERMEAAAARYSPTTTWPANDERYAPTATMKASPDDPGHPDDTNPGFRVADYVLPEA